jgi:hypothetical protein
VPLANHGMQSKTRATLRRHGLATALTRPSRNAWDEYPFPTLANAYEISTR